MKLMESGNLRALAHVHAEEKQRVLEENARLRRLLEDKEGEGALEAALTDKGETVKAITDADTALYSCLLLAAQQEVERARNDAERRVADATQASLDAAAAASSRAAVAERRLEEIEESTRAALAAVAEPLLTLAELGTAQSRLTETQACYSRERARAERLEGELKAERAAHTAIETLLEGNPASLAERPLPELEAWQARLRRAVEAASDAVVAARVTAARDEEAAAADAVIRAKEAAGVPMATDCHICMERPMDTALDCGHRACGVCAARINSCHACRTPVSLRLRLY